MSEFLTIPKWYDTNGNKCEGYSFNVGGVNEPVCIRNGRVVSSNYMNLNNGSGLEKIDHKNLLSICAGFAGLLPKVTGVGYNKDSTVIEVLKYLYNTFAKQRGNAKYANAFNPDGENEFYGADVDVSYYNAAQNPSFTPKIHGVCSLKAKIFSSSLENIFVLEVGEIDLVITRQNNNDLIENNCQYYFQLTGRYFYPQGRDNDRTVSCVSFVNNNFGPYVTATTKTIKEATGKYTQIYQV